MTFTRLKNLCLISLVIGLSACGWHLRGSLALDDDERLINLASQGISPELTREITTAFELNNITLTSADKAFYIVRVSDGIQDRRASSLGSDGVADSIAVSLQVTYSISDNQGQVLIPIGLSKVSRSYVYDRDNIAAKHQEELTIINELRRELAQQILRSFRYALDRSTNSDTPNEQTEAGTALPSAG